jgi:hypothetical protein
MQWILQQNDHQYEYMSLLTHEFPLRFFGLMYCLHNVASIHQQFCKKENYLRLDTWRLQGESSHIDCIQDYQDIFEITNNE